MMKVDVKIRINTGGPFMKMICRKFTLIEILIVFSIIGILAGMLVPSFATAKKRAKYVRWITHNAAWNSDPGTVLNFNFLDTEYTVVENGVKKSALANGAAGCDEDGFDTKFYDGIFRNGPTWLKEGGRWGYNPALQFDGVNDIVEVPGIKALNYDPVNRDISVMMWIYFDITVGSHVIFSKSRWLKSAQYDAYLYRDRIEADVGPVCYAWQNPKIDKDKWVHLAFTSDVNGNFQLYYNGEIMDEWRDDTYTAQDTMCDATFILGAAGMDNGPPAHYFKGRMDEFIMLGRALTPNEIKDHYNMGNPN